MGLFGDIKSRVILEYKADTEQAKQKLRELTGEQKKQAQAAVQGIEDQIKAHETLAGKITLGVGIAAGAIAIGIQGFKKYEEATRLSAATAGVSMDKLRTASHGLLTDMELMGVAAQGMNGRFALSSNEMETVLGAAVQLQRQGLMPLGEAAQKLGEAVKKGEIDPLKELGIAYDENLARTDKKAAALKALSSLSQQAAGTYQTETEAIQAQGVAFKQSVDEIASAIGRLVVAMGPLISATAQLVGLVADVIGAVMPPTPTSNADQRAFDQWTGGWHVAPAFLQGNGGQIEVQDIESLMAMVGNWGTNEAALYSIDQQRIAQATADGARRAATEAAIRASIQARQGRNAADRNRIAREGGWVEFGGKRVWVGPTRSGGGGSGGYELNGYDLQGQGMQLSPADQMMLDFARGRLLFPGGDTSASDALAASAPTGQRYYGALSGIGGANADALAAMMGTEYAKQPTITERLFGTPEEIDGYRTAWSGLTDTMLAGYDAMVSGSESVGSAMKKALGGAIQATGRKMFIRSLEETAEGVAALFLNPAAAGQHFAAAALFGAGSVAAGVAARELGAGGSTGGGVSRSAGASASGVGLGGGAMQPAPINRTFIIGDSYADEDPRTQRRRFGERIRRARATESDAEGTRYS